MAKFKEVANSYWRESLQTTQKFDIERVIEEIEEKVGGVSFLTQAIWRIGGQKFFPLDPNKLVIEKDGESVLNYLPQDDERRKRFEEVKQRLVENYVLSQDDVLIYAYLAEISEEEYLSLLANPKQLPSIDEIRKRAQEERWDLYGYFDDLLAEDPKTLEEWQKRGFMVPKKRSKEELYKQTLLIVRDKDPLPQTKYNPERFFDQSIFNFQEGGFALDSFKDYLMSLERKMMMLREMVLDNPQDSQLTALEAVLGDRLSLATREAAKQILLAADCGQCQLNHRERRQLENVLKMGNWSFIFGWNREIKDVFIEKNGRKAWQEKMKTIQKYLPTFSLISKKLGEMSEKRLPFAIELPEEPEKNQATNLLNEYYQKWLKRVKDYRRLRRTFIIGTLFAPIAALSLISKEPLVKSVVQDLPETAKAAYQNIFLLLGESAPSSLRRLNQIKDIASILSHQRREFGEDVFFQVGLDYFGKYIERTSQEYFPNLRIESSSDSELSEVNFLEQGPKLPQTLRELLTSLESATGRQRFIDELIYNFYQIGSFRFADEDRFTFIPQEELSQRLDNLIQRIKDLLQKEGDKSLSIDSLNSASRKQQAISDWQELIEEVLKYYIPQLTDCIRVLEPEIKGNPYAPSSYTDWPLEFVAKRLGYLQTEKLFEKIIDQLNFDIQPPINIKGQQELDNFFENNSYLGFNQQKFIQWLSKFSNSFGDDKTKWAFISWALSLNETGEIDLNLISSFVDLNRFNQAISRSSTSDGLIDGGVSASVAAGLIQSSLKGGIRRDMSRRDFLKFATVVGSSAAAPFLVHKIGEHYESQFEIVDTVLKKMNGRIWVEVEERLKPILTLNPLGFSQALIIRTKTGEELGRYFETNKESIPFEHIPEKVKKFLIAVEDKRFFDHNGVDSIGIIRALSSSGEGGGGSTLTQQLIRLLCFSQEELLKERTNSDLAYRRKAVEIVASLLFEKKWQDYFISRGYSEQEAKVKTKEKILELYLNNVPFGPNIYGIKAAAKSYFNKDPSQLTDLEIAFLIGIIQNPVGYNPLSTFYYDQSGQIVITGSKKTGGTINLNEVHPAVKRLRRDIIPLLIKMKVADEGLKDKALKTAITLTPFRPDSNLQPYIDQVINWLSRRLPPQKIFSGLEVNVSLDLGLQEELEQKILAEIEKEKDKGVDEGAIIILDGETGGILSVAGARAIPQDTNPIVDNGVVFGENFPGSSVKPITYAAALAEGKLAEGEKLTGNNYRGIRNAGNGNYENQPWPVALASSLNTAAQQLADRLGALRLRRLWDRLGLRKSESLSLASLSTNITLGTERVRPIDLARAYITFINDGKLPPTSLVSKVMQRGRELFNPQNQSLPVFSTDVAREIFNALGDPENKTLPNIETWTALRDSRTEDNQIWYFAKTGTESNPQGGQRAVWVAGGMIHPSTGKKYIVVTYLGTQNNQGMSYDVWGSSTLAPLWRSILDIIKGEEKNYQ